MISLSIGQCDAGFFKSVVYILAGNEGKLGDITRHSNSYTDLTATLVSLLSVDYL